MEIATFDENLPGRGRDQTRQQLQNRAFTLPTRTDHRYAFALLDLQVDVFQNHLTTEAQGDVPKL